MSKKKKQSESIKPVNIPPDDWVAVYFNQQRTVINVRYIYQKQKNEAVEIAKELMPKHTDDWNLIRVDKTKHFCPQKKTDRLITFN